MTETEQKPPIVQPSQLLVPKGETAASAVAAASKATIEARFMMALARPRDLDQYRQKLRADCKRPGFADAALYLLEFGEKPVEGLTVRFAEAALRHFGNVYCEKVVVFDDADKRIVRVTLTDLETNAGDSTDVTIQKTVERKKLKEGREEVGKRVNSKGDITHIVKAYDDEILGKVNAAMSKAKRNLILGLVPIDITEECRVLCKKVGADTDAKDPDLARKKVVDAFAELNVTAEELEEFMGKPLSRLVPAEVIELKRCYRALTDEEKTWEEIMEAKHPKQTAGRTKNALDEEKKQDPEKDRFGLDDLDADPTTKAESSTPSAEPSATGSKPTSSASSSPESKKPTSRTKTELLQEIGAFDLPDFKLADLASKVMGQTVLDPEKMKKEDLEKLLTKLQGE